MSPYRGHGRESTRRGVSRVGCPPKVSKGQPIGDAVTAVSGGTRSGVAEAIQADQRGGSGNEAEAASGAPFPSDRVKHRGML